MDLNEKAEFSSQVLIELQESSSWSHASNKYDGTICRIQKKENFEAELLLAYLRESEIMLFAWYVSGFSSLKNKKSECDEVFSLIKEKASVDEIIVTDDGSVMFFFLIKMRTDGDISNLITTSAETLDTYISDVAETFCSYYPVLESLRDREDTISIFDLLVDDIPHVIN